MARMHIRRRKRSKAEHAMEVAQSALKLWASTKVVKTAARKGWKLPAMGALLAGGAVAAKKLRGSSEPQPAYSPPAPYTPPQPDTKMHDKPHGDPAMDLPKPGDEVAPAAGGHEKTAGSGDRDDESSRSGGHDPKSRAAGSQEAARDEVAPASEST